MQTMLKRIEKQTIEILARFDKCSDRAKRNQTLPNLFYFFPKGTISIIELGEIKWKMIQNHLMKVTVKHL